MLPAGSSLPPPVSPSGPPHPGSEPAPSAPAAAEDRPLARTLEEPVTAPIASPIPDGERITVMRIIDRLNIGGPAIHAVVTSRGLDRSRFRTVLVIGSIEASEGDMAYLLEGAPVDKVVSIPSLGREMRPLRDLRTAWQLYRLMRQERPQVVHTHKAKAGALGRLVAFLCRVPVRIHTFHGHVLRGYFGAAKSTFYRVLERALARLSTQLVVPSARLGEELADDFRVAPRDRFEVIPLGFDLAPFTFSSQLRGELRQELGVGDDQRLVGIVGRMVPVKDHATFVAAADRLAQRRPEVRLVFVGGGEQLEAIRADVDRRGLTARCHFLGWRRDLHRIYADLDLVVLSSINEGTPVSLIEAMAAGTPVVATAVGGVPDVLQGGQRGGLVPPGDPAALAEAMEAGLSPAARDRAAQLRSAIFEEYGASRLCRQLETLYLRLLDQKRPSRVARAGH
jgi:glycosyltransferase involved in cell wall biosynthesis